VFFAPHTLSSTSFHESMLTISLEMIIYKPS
jgi:hypothetical protein